MSTPEAPGSPGTVPPAAIERPQSELPDDAQSPSDLDAAVKRARAKLALKIPDDAVPAAKSVPPPPVTISASSPPLATADPVPKSGLLANAIQAMRIIPVGDMPPSSGRPSTPPDAPRAPATVPPRPSSPPRVVSTPPRPRSTPPPPVVPPDVVSAAPEPPPAAPEPPTAPPEPAAAPEPPPPPATTSTEPLVSPLLPPPAEPISVAAADVLSEDDVAPAPDSAPAPDLAAAPLGEPKRAESADGIEVDVDHEETASADRISDVSELDAADLEVAESSPERRPAQPAPPPLVKPPTPPAAVVMADPATRKRGRAWWEDLFGDDFLRTMAKLTPVQVIREVTFIEDSLGVEQSGVVLDLACGVGHHAVELASRGYNVVGYDLSLAMLSRAADEAQDRDQKLNFLHGDMREMGFEDMFDGVYCWASSFGFFDEEANALVAERVHRALRHGGRFLLDVPNRDYVAARQPSLVWFEGEGCVCMDEMLVDFITSRLRVKRTVMLDDGRTREIDYSIRLYSLHELGKLLHAAGFKIAEVSGQPATPGVFFGADSPRLIILAEKA